MGLSQFALEPARPITPLDRCSRRAQVRAPALRVEHHEEPRARAAPPTRPRAGWGARTPKKAGRTWRRANGSSKPPRLDRAGLGSPRANEMRVKHGAEPTA